MKKQNQRKRGVTNYEGINFRESSIQLMIGANYFLNLLILTIKNRINANDFYLSHRNLLKLLGIAKYHKENSLKIRFLVPKITTYQSH